MTLITLCLSLLMTINAMDTYKTPVGDVSIHYFGHASLLIEWNGKNIYVDPYGDVQDYKGLASADLILCTHEHGDHYDAGEISKIATPETKLIVNGAIGNVDSRYLVLKNGEQATFGELLIKAVPAYNINRRKPDGSHFHPAGIGNGYLLDFGGFVIYIAGDTEPIKEMADLKDIDLAFLPKNLPYTMTDEEFVAAANLIKPRMLFPYHYFEIDYDALRKGLDKNIKLIENK